MDAPFSLYLGWISVAAIANVAAVLDSAGWSGWGLSQEAWMGVALALVVALAWLLALREREGCFLPSSFGPSWASACASPTAAS